MKPRITLWITLLSALLTGVGHTAGGPMNEDLTPLLPASQKALEAGKSGDAETFLKEAKEALAQAKEFAPSAAQQRVVGKLKIAVAEGKDGKLAEGVLKVEEAMSDMKKAGPPRFGGGT
jgi:hypothetical protein